MDSAGHSEIVFSFNVKILVNWAKWNSDRDLKGFM